MVGMVLLVPGVALCLRPGRLVVPQLVAPAGLALVLATVDWTSYAVSAFDLAGPVSVLSLAGLCALGRRLGADVLAWVAGTVAAASWAGAGLWSLAEATAHPSARELWVEGHGWELMLVSLLSLLLWTVAWSESLVRQGCAALVAVAATYVTVLPGLDGTPTELAVIAIAVTLAWALVAAATPLRLVRGRRGCRSPRVPSVLRPRRWHCWRTPPRRSPRSGRRSASRPRSGSSRSSSPCTRSCYWPRGRPRHCRPGRPAQAEKCGARRGSGGRVGRLRHDGLYAVPLWVVLAGAALVATGLLAVALRRQDGRASYLAGGAGAVGVALVAAALPSLVLVTLALASGRPGPALTITLRSVPLRHGGRRSGAARRPGRSHLVGGELADVDPAQRAVPVIVVVALLALFLVRTEVELSAAATGLVAAAAAIPYAEDVSVSLAVHLTLAGALVTTSSIVHPSRRLLAWPGGLLLAAATWVRLADLGVEAPEAYTLSVGARAGPGGPPPDAGRRRGAATAHTLARAWCWRRSPRCSGCSPTR